MSYCKNCGAHLAHEENVCPNCGTTQSALPIKDEGGFLWGLLGCCIPIVGLVLYLVWHDTKPNTAKAAGMGALICVVSYALFYLFFILLGFGFTTAFM